MQLALGLASKMIKYYYGLILLNFKLRGGI